MSKDIVYKVTISTSNKNDTKDYTGLTFTEFYPQKYSNETELYHKLVNIEKLFFTREDHNDVIYVWKKELGILKEKGKSLLNIRSEIVSAYLHKNRFQINNLNKERNSCYLNAHVS